MKTFDAQSVARDAALAEAEFATQVGDFVSVDYDDDNRVATYLFAADIAGYRGWRWCVTVAKVDDEATPTVCDVVVLPGPDSLLAPDHVPYMERILPEDIQPGVIVPSVLEDTRLVPGVNALAQDEGLDATEVFDLGLMRPRVLSIEGRDQASKRWYTGDSWTTFTTCTECAKTMCFMWFLYSNCWFTSISIWCLRQCNRT
jgi:hypothetical protein